MLALARSPRARILSAYKTARISSFNTMTDVRGSLSHEERTAKEPREGKIHEVKIWQVTQINDTIRTIRLNNTDPTEPIKHLAGQWVDVFIPGLTKAGGFTITTAPKKGVPTEQRPATIELAIQLSGNPPAKWLSGGDRDILGQNLKVRVGGNFTWPPPNLDPAKVKRLVLVAGGVGINPLIAIMRDILTTTNKSQHPTLEEIELLYSSKASSQPVQAACILFMSEIKRMEEFNQRFGKPRLRLKVFVTNAFESDLQGAIGLPNQSKARRVQQEDLDVALGSETSREGTLCYVCGPPAMTDSFVEHLSNAKGMHPDRVLCEKWW